MSRTALVIGLDGMPRTLLEQFARDGVMSNTAALLSVGSLASLRAPVPEISSTSWATFMTGVNPGRHGIYGFSDLRPGSYETCFPSIRDLRTPALWEHAAAAGLRTICVNVPGTYPAPEIDGVLVSGFVAPKLERAVTPLSLLGTLREFEYELDVEVAGVKDDPGAFLGRALRALRARTRAIEHLLQRESWDLAVTVLTETDRVQHFLWAAVADPGHPLHPAVLDFYRAVDESVGALAAAAGPRAALFLVSDHGFGPADCQFYINAWLRASGWLAGLEHAPALDRLDARSSAFALDPARIYVHRASRFPRGGLSDSDAAAVAEQIAEELGGLRRDGDRV
ncbi:MAG TPA: alkaline phosphatase family protein, partial [Actinospica sp.]|nr:alkaline phosphatase family protein [Actinospica sp.]